MRASDQRLLLDPLWMQKLTEANIVGIQFQCTVSSECIFGRSVEAAQAPCKLRNVLYEEDVDG
jgi:hypothetical protein